MEPGSGTREGGAADACDAEEARPRPDEGQREEPLLEQGPAPGPDPAGGGRLDLPDEVPRRLPLAAHRRGADAARDEADDEPHQQRQGQRSLVCQGGRQPQTVVLPPVLRGASHARSA